MNLELQRIVEVQQKRDVKDAFGKPVRRRTNSNRDQSTLLQFVGK
jgi:hypothetical protein